MAGGGRGIGGVMYTMTVWSLECWLIYAGAIGSTFKYAICYHEIGPFDHRFNIVWLRLTPEEQG